MRQTVLKKSILLILAVFCLSSCAASSGEDDSRSSDTDSSTVKDAGADGDVDGDTDTSSDGDIDTDADADSDADTDTDSDADSDSDSDTDSDSDNMEKLSYIWVANTGDGTLSKIDTREVEEVARYVTSPQGSDGDPSRTSVNLHGDMVVTNREPKSGPSSVTKFATSTDDCLDRNNNGKIDTSKGPDDVMPWGEDECMIWNTPLDPLGDGEQIGARGTAWDGTEDQKTGQGGSVWITSVVKQYVFKLNGDTGEIEEHKEVGFCGYGAAVGKEDKLWIAHIRNGMCISYDPDPPFDTLDNWIVEFDMKNLEYSQYRFGGASYGITVDSDGDVWISDFGHTDTTGGKVGLGRFDPTTEKYGYANLFPYDDMDFTIPRGRGVAVGIGKSAGYVWVAESTDGFLMQVDQKTLEVVEKIKLGEKLVGVAIDYQGYVWAVSKKENSVYKVNPKTYEYEAIKVGKNPYTYSDMTGVQLNSVVVVK